VNAPYLKLEEGEQPQGDGGAQLLVRLGPHVIVQKERFGVPHDVSDVIPKGEGEAVVVVVVVVWGVGGVGGVWVCG
jgi:hypothetical protein